ncbi:MAG: hypothetical protein HYV28_10785 [Ignavibacteriales bacterium]|nr:hypothetical protein [Ignavibacteriales bacterium]
MKNKIFQNVLILLFTVITIQAQSVSIPVTISDNATVPNSLVLYYGLDTTATDGIDLNLGESELPPMPPSGNFEVRLFLPSFTGSLASLSDYRYGTSAQSGTYEYRLRYQKHATATNITVTWNMPAGVTGVLKDVATNGVVINKTMTGSSSYTVANPNSFNQLKMFITYNLGPINVAVKAVPEGFFNTDLNRLNISDTFKVYLASAVSPNTFVDSTSFVIDSVTFTGMAAFRNAPSGLYYLVISGRNTIQTWSKIGGEALSKNSTATYNFDSLQTQAFGSNLTLINTHWCLYAGDVNQDQFVDFTDLTLVDNDSYNFTGGYVATDINGDAFVDFTDLTLVDNNSYNFIGTIRP